MEFTPDSGVVAAEWPLHSFTGAAAGIRTVRAEGPAGAQPSCFTLCETAMNGPANEVANVVESAVAGAVSTYTITLARPVTPNAVTAITYTDVDGMVSTMTIFAHPGNVNGDAMTSVADLTSLLNYLRGSNPSTNAPWGLFSADIDGSGAVTSADLASLIDLLNGGGPNQSWNNTPKPTTTGTCPPPP
jgi:hypothetical protein